MNLRASSLGWATLRYAASLALLMLLWVAIGRLAALPLFILPTPASVFQALVAERATFAHATAYTLQNAAVGAVLGVGLGFLTGVLTAVSPKLRWIAEPYLIIFQSFPREALVPLFVVWLGFGWMPKVLSAALLAYFPMAVLTANGLLDTRRDYIDLVRSWGATRFQELLHCRLPALVPALVGGIGKVCLPLALIGAVLGEMTGGGNYGLGYIVITSGAVSRVDRVFGALLILGATGAGVLAAVNALQSALRRFNQE